MLFCLCKWRVGSPHLHPAQCLGKENWTTSPFSTSTQASELTSLYWKRFKQSSRTKFGSSVNVFLSSNTDSSSSLFLDGLFNYSQTAAIWKCKPAELFPSSPFSISYALVY